jgi:hypothetical protein
MVTILGLSVDMIGPWKPMAIAWGASVAAMHLTRTCNGPFTTEMQGFWRRSRVSTCRALKAWASLKTGWCTPNSSCWP